MRSVHVDGAVCSRPNRRSTFGDSNLIHGNEPARAEPSDLCVATSYTLTTPLLVTATRETSGVTVIADGIRSRKMPVRIGVAPAARRVTTSSIGDVFPTIAPIIALIGLAGSAHTAAAPVESKFPSHSNCTGISIDAPLVTSYRNPAA